MSDERVWNTILGYLRTEFLCALVPVFVLCLRKVINKGESKMEKEVVIGTEGKVEVKLANGKLYLIGKYDGAQVDADLAVGIEVDLFIDQLAAKIPGQVDDAILGVLKAALKVI